MTCLTAGAPGAWVRSVSRERELRFPWARPAPWTAPQVSPSPSTPDPPLLCTAVTLNERSVVVSVGAGDARSYRQAGLYRAFEDHIHEVGGAWLAKCRPREVCSFACGGRA